MAGQPKPTLQSAIRSADRQPHQAHST